MNEDAPKMKTIEVTARTNRVGSNVSDTFEIEANASDTEIDAAAREVMYSLIEWSYGEVPAE